MSVPVWHIDQAVAARVMERFNARRNPPVVDYEHQTLHKETNGQPAPAAPGCERCNGATPACGQALS